ncbi:helix-turn-helix domain protein [Coriobacterium glomerans PW2]|uniref:Helix-turn-helix domain protein n=1 Tax=Coriobacterium glomerans (strain ATCC 49209 / DSM 20642 / JCM 10262 / PW2) TaxID=700015 RepID=F2N8F5_CORGP|nr:helix-turn-helix domain protein [Coriobacterium glomerans PW2]
MNLQLVRLRKAAGYVSRRTFSEALGVPERQIKAWEDRERKLRLEDACDIADLLHCTLDELAGRDFSPVEFSDPQQADLNRCYESSTEEQRAFILQGARNAALASRDARGGC